jgi:cold shock CspA family protein
MAIGTVKLLRPDKGFGLIKCDRGSKGSVTLTFDRAAISVGDFSKFWPGQRVSFDETSGPSASKNRCAVNVRPEREL